MVANIPTAAAAITAVAAQPTTLRPSESVNRPMTFGRTVSNIIMTITGTATTPLITALQNNALTGSMGVKLSAGSHHDGDGDGRVERPRPLELAGQAHVPAKGLSHGVGGGSGKDRDRE